MRNEARRDTYTAGSGPQKAGLNGHVAPRMANEDCLQCMELVRTHTLAEPPATC